MSTSASENRTPPDLVRRMMSTFAVPPNADGDFLEPLNATIGRASKPFVEIGNALRANIEGLISTVSVPYTLAQQAATDRHWQSILTAERIRSQMIDANPDETQEELELRREREALKIATSKMKSFLCSPEGTDVLVRNTVAFLESLRSKEAVLRAANELILQGVVLCWGTFEVLARDCFVVHLNMKPSRTLVLLEDPVAKRRFELSKVALETLASHNFNLSERMGSVLAERQDLSDVYSVKSVYQALFADNKALADALNDSDLRLLSLRRNLIVHRCGVIDTEYATAANCSQKIGERLTASPDNLEKHLITIMKVASNILDAVSAAT